MAPSRILLLPAGSVNHRQVPSTRRGALPSTRFVTATQVKIDPSSSARRFNSLINPTPIVKTRKRERLTGLTDHEKMVVRQMKNRASAQAARDRKKERTCKLENAVKYLQYENRRLREENDTLTDRLTGLEQQLATTRPVPMSLPSLHMSTTVATPLGSAASINELQQRAQALTTVSTVTRGGTVSRLDLVPMVMLLLSSLPSTLTFSKTSETSMSIKCAPPFTRITKRRQRLTLHRLISKRPGLCKNLATSPFPMLSRQVRATSLNGKWRGR